MPVVSIKRPGLASGFAILVACSLLTIATAQEPAPSALETDPGGWTDLLAGVGPDLKGWVRGPIPPPPKGMLREPSQWKLDASTGHLVCEGDGGHDWLRWDHELGDSIFHVEFRYTPVVEGKKGYNSGIYARNSADARVWHQAQIGAGSGGFLFGETPAKDGEGLARFNTLEKSKPSRVKPAGEWNTLEITSKGKDLTVWTNGAVTANFRECGAPRGYVGLEAEGYRIEFRNVKLKPLDKSKEAGR